MTAPLRRFASFDPGSRRLGCIVGETGPDRWTRAAPGALTIVAALPVDVDPHDLATAAAVAFEFAVAHGVSGVVVERGALYMPQDVTPQAARQIAANHAIMSRLADILEGMAVALGMKARTCARQSWAHAVIPRTKGGITDAMVLAALPRYLPRASMALLTTKDLRDAAGALLWSLLPPNTRIRARDPNYVPKPRPPWLPGEREAGYAGKLRRKRRLALVANRARRARKRAARLALDPVAELVRVTAPCPCGPHPRGRRPATCPRAPEPRPGGNVCRLCGWPRSGHPQQQAAWQRAIYAAKPCGDREPKPGYPLPEKKSSAPSCASVREGA